MKRELGIARCGLACCLCSENVGCNGCNSGECPDKEWCENRTCSIKKDSSGRKARWICFMESDKPEKNGVVYHREGIYGDYDGFTDLEELIAFIKNAPDLLVR